MGAAPANLAAVTPQPFFEAALNPAYCAGFASCTAAVASKEGNAGTGNIRQDNVWSLWSDLDNGNFNFPRTMINTPVFPAWSAGQLHFRCRHEHQSWLRQLQCWIHVPQDGPVAWPDPAKQLHLIARHWAPARKSKPPANSPFPMPTTCTPLTVRNPGTVNSSTTLWRSLRTAVLQEPAGFHWPRLGGWTFRRSSLWAAACRCRSTHRRRSSTNFTVAARRSAKETAPTSARCKMPCASAHIPSGSSRHNIPTLSNPQNAGLYLGSNVDGPACSSIRTRLFLFPESDPGY